MRTAMTQRIVGKAALMLAVTLGATACGDGGDAGGTATSGKDTTHEEPTGGKPAPLTITAEERASADVVLITGEAREDLELGGYGFEGEEIISPGPTIRVRPNKPVTIALENIHGYVDNELVSHNFLVVEAKDDSEQPLWGAQTEILQPGEADIITFTPDAPGKYFYICSLPFHMRFHGMWGRFVVEAAT